MPSLRDVMQALLDPKTNMGTARWVALGMAAYDITKNHLNLVNGGLLLLLAGVDIAARWFNTPPSNPTAAA